MRPVFALFCAAISLPLLSFSNFPGEATESSAIVESRVVVTSPADKTGGSRFELTSGDLIQTGARFRVELRARQDAVVTIAIKGAQGAASKPLFEGALKKGQAMIAPANAGWFEFSGKGRQEVEVTAKPAGNSPVLNVGHSLFLAAADVFDLSAAQEQLTCVLGQVGGGAQSKGGSKDRGKGKRDGRNYAASFPISAGLWGGSASTGANPQATKVESATDLDDVIGLPSQSRGAAEVSLYRTMAPGVVLILGENSLGSGSILTANGEILTNNHVVEGARQVRVVLKPRSDIQWTEVDQRDIYRADVVKVDPTRDLALIRLISPPDDLTVLEVGDLSSLEVGADVHAIGNPHGQGWTYTKGIVSQIRRGFEWQAGSEGGGEQTSHRALAVIQTQTPISPGSSGGPLISDGQKIIGVNTFVRSGSAQGLNYAVSAEDVRVFLDSKGQPPQVRDATAEEGQEDARKGSREGSGGPGQTVQCDGSVRVIDRNENGRVDLVIVDADDDGEVDIVILDNDEDGQLDAVVIDRDGDGTPDTWLIDRNGDARADVVGLDVDQDGEIDRYKMIG